VTHPSTLDMQLYLRALGLHLKRLIVGGMGGYSGSADHHHPKGISARHGRFTMMELYRAFAHSRR
jgi:lysyl-tRNA synthetase class II